MAIIDINDKKKLKNMVTIINDEDELENIEIDEDSERYFDRLENAIEAVRLDKSKIISRQLFEQIYKMLKSILEFRLFSDTEYDINNYGHNGDKLRETVTSMFRIEVESAYDNKQINVREYDRLIDLIDNEDFESSNPEYAEMGALIEWLYMKMHFLHIKFGHDRECDYILDEPYPDNFPNETNIMDLDLDAIIKNIDKIKSGQGILVTKELLEEMNNVILDALKDGEFNEEQFNYLLEEEWIEKSIEKIRVLLIRYISFKDMPSKEMAYMIKAIAEGDALSEHVAYAEMEAAIQYIYDGIGDDIANQFF